MVVGTLKKGRGAAPPAILSPFKGGLNNVGEGATIADDEVAVLQNFDIDTDGTLVNRPPIENTGVLPPMGATNVPNLATNPRLTVDATGWTANGNAGTSPTFGRLTSGAAYPFATYARLVMGASADGLAGIAYTQDATFTPGATYTFALYGQAAKTGGQYMQTRLIWYNSSGTEIGSRSYSTSRLTTTTGGFVERFVVSAAAPSGATRFQYTLLGGDGKFAWATGDAIYATALTVTQSAAAPTYVDGDKPSTVNDRFEWVGTANASVTNHWDMANDPAPVFPIGYYVRNDGVTFMVATCGGRTWIYDLVAKTWTAIWSNEAADFAQYDNKIVVISETRAGGYWENGTFTATSTMPFGSQIVIYNERFWAFGPKGTANATTIYFSNITAVSPATSIYTWTTATDFFVVDKGDGQYITSIVADPNALLIFRNSSTYQFTYPNAPANGTLSLLNSSVGADNKNAVTRYENYYWILNQGFLYQFISYQFYARNAQVVRFMPAPAGPTRYVDSALSVLGERILVYYFGSLYVYSIRQQTWAQWTPSVMPGKVMQMPADSSGTGPRQALAWAALDAGTASRRVLLITDSPTGSGLYGGEQMTCTVRTKTYDFNLAGTFKRLLYWAVGFRSSSGVTGQVVPVGVNGNSVTFDDMEGVSFDAFDLATWDAPLFKVPVFADNIPFPMPVPVQALAKAKAAIRFLSVYFQVTLNTKGTSATAPARVFSLTAYLKQHSDTRDKVA